MVHQNNEKDSSAYSVSLEQNANKNSCEKWWEIDKDMIRIKLQFFLISGVSGSACPFLAVIAKNRLGLSATSFATVMVFTQFITVLSKALIGFITDYFNKLKLVLYVLVVFQTFLLYLFLILPAIPKEVNISDNKTFIYCSDSEVHCNNKMAIEFLNCCEFIENSSCYLNTSQTQLNSAENLDLGADNLNFSQLRNDLIQPDNFTAQQNLDKTFRVIVNDFSLRIYFKFCPEELRENITSLFNQSSINYLFWSKLSNESSISLNNSMICYCHKEQNDSSNLLIENKLQPIPTATKSDFQTYHFWAFFAVFTMFYICKGSMFALSDTACCENVQKTGADFGQQRLYGSVGWGLFAPIAGYLNDYTNDYLVSWIVITVLSLILLWNISKLDLVKPQNSKSLLRDIGSIITSKQFLFYEVGVFATGIGVGFLFSYLGWFIVSIGGNRLLCGLAETIQCLVGEILFMYFSGWLLKKMGYFNVTTLSLLSHCVRFLWYSQLQNPWMILPIEWTSGISYGLFCASMASYAKKSATPGAEATMQSVVFATYEGLGSGIGNILAGFGFDYLGTKQTFFYTGVFFACCSVFSFVISVITCYKDNLVKTKS